MVGVCLVGPGLARSGAPVEGSGERIERFESRIEISSDGSAAVTEVIVRDVGSNRHAGFDRLLPAGVLPDAPITLHTDGVADDVVVTTDQHGTRLLIGDRDVAVSGRHTYRIEYRLTGLVDGDHVDWPALGLGWGVPIDKAELELVAPYELTDVVCFHGRPGDEEPCEVQRPASGRLSILVRDIEPGQGVRAGATARPSGGGTVASGGGLSRLAWALPAAALVLGLGTAAAVVRIRNRRRGSPA